MQKGWEHGEEEKPGDAVLDKGRVSEICRDHDVVVQGNPRVYKALRDQLAAVLDDLRRIEAGLTFEIEKGRLSFRLTAPYSEERRSKASAWAKKRGRQAGK